LGWCKSPNEPPHKPDNPIRVVASPALPCLVLSFRPVFCRELTCTERPICSDQPKSACHGALAGARRQAFTASSLSKHVFKPILPRRFEAILLPRRRGNNMPLPCLLFRGPRL